MFILSLYCILFAKRGYSPQALALELRILDMTINEYTTILVKLLKETKIPEGTIWDACVDNQRLNGHGFDEL